VAEFPVTAAVRALRAAQIEFVPHQFTYEERGGTAHSAAALGVDEHAVIKTLIFEDETRAPLVILQHGDREVSTKQLARDLGKKSITPCKPDVAQKHSGYLVGGTSPFGLKRAMPIYAESSIFELPTIYINGGKRGFLVAIDPKAMRGALTIETVSVAI
jgi:Cys-tRNA(Pro) deacylase